MSLLFVIEYLNQVGADFSLLLSFSLYNTSKLTQTIF